MTTLEEIKSGQLYDCSPENVPEYLNEKILE